MDEVLGHYSRLLASQLWDVMQQAGFDIEHMIKFNRVSRRGWYINGCLCKEAGDHSFAVACLIVLSGCGIRLAAGYRGSTSLIAIGVKNRV